MRAFAVGAVGYAAIELMVRKKTHWTMAVTGGVCFLLMHRFCQKRKAASRLHKCLVGMALITGIEFAVGSLVNRVLKWAMWDYSNHRFNLRGQICPRFSLYWFLLGIPMILLSDRLARRME